MSGHTCFGRAGPWWNASISLQDMYPFSSSSRTHVWPWPRMRTSRHAECLSVFTQVLQWYHSLALNVFLFSGHMCSGATINSYSMPCCRSFLLSWHHSSAFGLMLLPLLNIFQLAQSQASQASQAATGPRATPICTCRLFSCLCFNWDWSLLRSYVRSGTGGLPEAPFMPPWWSIIYSTMHVVCFSRPWTSLYQWYFQIHHTTPSSKISRSLYLLSSPRGCTSISGILTILCTIFMPPCIFPCRTCHLQPETVRCDVLSCGLFCICRMRFCVWDDLSGYLGACTTNLFTTNNEKLGLHIELNDGLFRLAYFSGMRCNWQVMGP